METMMIVFPPPGLRWLCCTATHGLRHGLQIFRCSAAELRARYKRRAHSSAPYHSTLNCESLN
jgi:hypothetical protein